MAPSMIFMIVFDALILLGAVILFLRPSFTLKLLTWILRHTLVRLRVEGLENIPDSGPVLIVSNHVSLIDMLLIQSVSRRPVRFMVHQEVLEFVPTRFIFWYLGVIRVPVDPAAEGDAAFFPAGTRRTSQRGGALPVSGGGNLRQRRAYAFPFRRCAAAAGRS